MRQTANKKLTATLRIYRIHHDCRVHATAIFRSELLVYVDHLPLAGADSNQLATDLYSKLLLRKMDHYCVISSMAETVKVDEEGTPNTI